MRIASSVSPVLLDADLGFKVWSRKRAQCAEQSRKNLRKRAILERKSKTTV